MVHGLGGSALNWMAVGPEIASSYHAIAVDLAGFGQTPLFSRSANVGGNADLVHEFIEKVIGEPVVIMGNSMGGHIAILEAAVHPSSVHAMILLDPRVRVLGPEGLVRETLASVCADPSRVPAEVVEAHIRLTRERDNLGRQ